MKTSHYLSLACAAVLGTGRLISVDAPPPVDGTQPEAAAGDTQPVPPPVRPGPNNPPPPPAAEPPLREGRPGSGEAPRPPRPPGDPDGGRPDGNFRPQNGGPGNRPFRTDGQPGERPYRPNGEADERNNDERPPRPYANQPVPMKLQAYLGVITRAAGADVAAQLKQPEGFGLVVEDVLPEGPAAAAGLQPNDFLRLLDDQLLVNPSQLEALVRRAGKDKEVTLTILRGGAEQKVVAKVGEKMMPVRRPLQPVGNGGTGEPFPGGQQYFLSNQFQAPRDGLRPNEDYAPGPPRAGQPGFDRETRYAMDRARVVRRDESGIYWIARVNGTRIFSARHTDGTEIWHGPVDTEDDKKAMPEEVRKKFEEIEKSRPLDRLGERPNQPGGAGPDDPRPPRPGPGDGNGQRPAGPPPARDGAPQ